MSALVVFCGLDCAQCEAYQATQANDRAWQERILAKWRANFSRGFVRPKNLGPRGGSAAPVRDRPDRPCRIPESAPDALRRQIVPTPIIANNQEAGCQYMANVYLNRKPELHPIIFPL